jgi:hypothetical protein
VSAAGFAELEARLVGHPFPGGTFVVEEFERWLSHDGLQSPDIPPPGLHPVWVVLGALRGMGITIEDLIELADATPDDGVVFGETWLEQHRTLQAGVEYTVRGGVKSLVRREGRRAGTFDVLTFELELCESGGEVAAVSSQSFVIRRGAAPDAG